jgi:hypothetical protein
MTKRELPGTADGFFHRSLGNLAVLEGDTDVSDP